jgi:ubiquinone biosynthesis protein Coq4
MKNPLDKLRFAKALLDLVRDLRTVGNVFDLVDSVVDESSLRGVADRMRQTPEGARGLKQRPRLDTIRLAGLSALPAGTLGRAFYEHMRQNGLDPAAMPHRPASSELSYIVPHFLETHDIWHVVTGLGTDPAGELGLQAFYAAQGLWKAPLAILSAGLLNALIYQNDSTEERLEAIARGWLLGRRAHPMFGVAWAEHWDVPLAEVRQRFGIDLAGVEILLETRRQAPQGLHP